MSPQPSREVAAALPSFVAVGRRGVEVRLRVTPRAQSGRIDGVVADADGRCRLKVAVTEAADRGRANDAVIAALAREWDLPKSALAIVAGAADRRKTLAVTGDVGELQQRLAGWCRARGLS